MDHDMYVTCNHSQCLFLGLEFEERLEFDALICLNYHFYQESLVLALVGLQQLIIFINDYSHSCFYWLINKKCVRLWSKNAKRSTFFTFFVLKLF